ncbi:GlcNAc-transferase family protein [uncultured Salinisphaera sp.]|uniref:GlcNAc-transferase family protein n=1 Tax=uncultured Salinisphaera sp. TaxID=359372 RepID=UPI0032B10C32
MQLNPAEISDLIKKRIENFETVTESRNVGTLVSLADGIARIHGLANAMQGEMLEFPGGTYGVALNLERDSVGAVLMGEYRHISEGCEVKTTGKVLEVPVGRELLGRVVDPLGNAIDGKGEIDYKQTSPIEKVAPGVIARQSVDQPVQTGLKAVDAMVPIGRGQRELIIGDRQIGKTAVAIDAIINQKGTGIKCIYVAIGQKNSSVANTVRKLEEHGAMEHTIVVNAGAAISPALQYMAPYAGCSMGEFFRDRGEDAVLFVPQLEQVDAHLRFAPEWDAKYIAEARACKNYPKAVLSSYPPGFTGGAARWGTPGARLCSCEFSTSDVEASIIRINVGRTTHAGASAPTQIAFIAAGFFFARAEFLRDVPFDPLLPWCFMGEEIALSTRAWTAGWDIYAPRENLIAHEYRPGRMGLPKFWGSVGRVFGRPGFNTPLMLKVVQRVKHMIGYPDSALEKLTAQGDTPVLTDAEHYGMGTERPLAEYMKLTGIDVEHKRCPAVKWCNNEELL